MGSGLGLTITRSLVHHMHGTIEVASSLGQGSKFTIILPIEPDTHHCLQNELPLVKSMPTFLQTKQIILAEDNILNQEIICTLLKDLNINISVANNGQEAVNLIKSIKADLILMDLRMPLMDGITACQTILANPDQQHIPIIGLSADTFSESKNNAQAAGMVDFITKPINFNELYTKLAYWL